MNFTLADAANSPHREADVAVFLQGLLLLIRRRLWLILAVVSLAPHWPDMRHITARQHTRQRPWSCSSRQRIGSWT